MLVKAGHEHNVDMDLLASVVKAESGGNARAVSRAGAQGLMQLMPATAADLGVSDSFKPEQNVRGGSTYLDALLTRYHNNLALALAAYNAGPAAVDKYNGIPPYRETKLYVARVIHEFNRRVKAREAQTRRDAETRRRVSPQGNCPPSSTPVLPTPPVDEEKRMIWVRDFPPLRQEEIARMGHGAYVSSAEQRILRP